MAGAGTHIRRARPAQLRSIDNAAGYRPAPDALPGRGRGGGADHARSPAPAPGAARALPSDRETRDTARRAAARAAPPRHRADAGRRRLLREGAPGAHGRRGSGGSAAPMGALRDASVPGVPTDARTARTAVA